MNEISELLHPSKKNLEKKQAYEDFFSSLDNDLFRLGYYKDHAYQEGKNEWKLKKNVDLDANKINPECFSLRKNEVGISFFETKNQTDVICKIRQNFYNYPDFKKKGEKNTIYTLEQAQEFCIPLRLDQIKFNNIISENSHYKKMFNTSTNPDIKFTRDKKKKTLKCDDTCKMEHETIHCSITYADPTEVLLISNFKIILSQSFVICENLIAPSQQ